MGADARDRLMQGIDTLANAVKSTLGPRGRVMMIDKGARLPYVTKDGVTVSEAVVRAGSDDPVAQMGMNFVHEVASSTNLQAGDGTTTATVLAQAIARNGMKHMSDGANPVLLERGISLAVECVSRMLKDMAIVAGTREEIEHVATISANGDKSIGAIVAEAVDSVGLDGVITVDPGSGAATTLEITRGTSWGQGFLDPVFINHKATATVNMEEPLIVLCAHTVTNQNWVIPALQIANDKRRPLLIICEGMEGNAMNLVATNAAKGMVVCVVKAPAERVHLRTSLEDIAAVTGATIMDDHIGTSMEIITFEQMGTAEKAVVSAWNTALLGGGGDQALVDDRITNLKSQSVGDSEMAAAMLRGRIAMLSGCAASIKVGSATGVGSRELRDRVIDSVSAALAAKRQGILPGGGIALLRISMRFPDCQDHSKDVRNGWESVKAAMKEPFRCILSNAGHDPSEILASMPQGDTMGFDADRNKYGDMMEAGIVDPLLVTLTALVNAASVAGLILLTEGAILQGK